MSWNNHGGGGGGGGGATRWGSSSSDPPRNNTGWGGSSTGSTGWGSSGAPGFSGAPPPPPPPPASGWGSSSGSSWGGGRGLPSGQWERGGGGGSAWGSGAASSSRPATTATNRYAAAPRSRSNHQQSSSSRRASIPESPKDRDRSRDRSRSRSRDRRKRSRSRDRKKDRSKRKEDDGDKHSIFAELLGMGGDRGKSPSPEKVPEPPKKTTLDEKARQKRMRVKLEKLCTNVTIKPKDKAPKHIECFKDQKNLPKVILDNLEREKFTIPTPVQKYSIPVLMEEMDSIVCATTGSGKTMAFLIPLVANLLNGGEVSRPFFKGKNACAAPLVLILAPTRELCIQIDEQVYIVTKDTWISSFAIFGGDNYAQQATQVGKGQIDVLSATPGRLVDMLDGCKISFQFIKCLAFDEADNMLELGFEKAITDIVTGRDMPPREKRHTVMFSATFPNKIKELAKKFLRDDNIFIRLGETGRTTKMITQKIKWVEPRNKNVTLLHDLALTQNKVIVFVGRRQHADKVATFLQGKGIQAGSLHGNQDQDTREEAIHNFKDDMFRVLCATDVAARGLDFPEIELVLNYDMPQNLEVYTHRIGRTGRIGTAGVALSYFGPQNQNLATQLADYLRDSKQEVPTWLENMAFSRGGRKSRWPRSGGQSRSNNSAPSRWRGA